MIIDEAECMRLLGQVRVGRVALTRRALPVVVPVGFALDGATIVLRTAPDSALGTSPADVVVAFEAGELDPDSGAGWSVLVTGTITQITEPAALEHARSLRPAQWADDRRHCFVRLAPGLVSGSRVDHANEHSTDDSVSRTALV